MSDLKRGDIIQANENSGWCGAVLVVSEVKDWGVQAYVTIPMEGEAYVRLRHDQYDLTGGRAVLMPKQEVRE